MANVVANPDLNSYFITANKGTAFETVSFTANVGNVFGPVTDRDAKTRTFERLSQ